MYQKTFNLNIKTSTLFRAVFEEFDNDGKSIAINEINYNSAAENDTGDWIELYNYGNAPLNLANIFITDNFAKVPKTKLPILGAFLDGENVHTFNFSTVSSTSPTGTSITAILLTLTPASVISSVADANDSALSDSTTETVTIVPGGSSTPGKGFARHEYIAKSLYPSGGLAFSLAVALAASPNLSI